MESHLLKNTTILLGELTSSSHACLEAIHSKRTNGKLKRRLLEKKKEKKKRKKNFDNADFLYLSSANTFSVIFNLHCFYHNPSMCLPWRPRFPIVLIMHIIIFRNLSIHPLMKYLDILNTLTHQSDCYIF